MTDVLFFPDNKLGAEICPVFNDHIAIISQNTDRLKDGKFALAELNLFKYNIQGTSFLNPVAVLNNENANYAQTLADVKNSGRISFGLYYRTDRWVNPNTGQEGGITDYYSNTWTSAGASIFANAVEGASKDIRYPNHGQEMYDVSNGELGYDFLTQAFGVSGASETINHTVQQVDYFKGLADIEISSGSYANGQNDAAGLLIPNLICMRDSGYSVSGNGLVDYASLSRADLISRSSTTRTWDAERANQFLSQNESLNYSRTQIQNAIATNGWYSDFMHWHSLYDFDDTPFFESFYSAIHSETNGQNVWMAGNNEAAEYYALQASIDKVGSFVDGGKVQVFVRFKDAYSGTQTNGIDNELPLSIQTPLSIKVDLTGTPLAGLNVTSKRAVSVRSLGLNVFVFNVKPAQFKDGYFTFTVEEAAYAKYYDSAKPVLSFSGGTVTADKPCKFVAWRKQTGSPDSAIECTERSGTFKTSFNPVTESGYDYWFGGITESRNSAVLSVQL